MKIASPVRPRKDSPSYSHPGAVYCRKHVKIWVCHMHIIEEKAGHFSGEKKNFMARRKN